MRLDTLPVQPKEDTSLGNEARQKTVPVAQPGQINLASLPEQPKPEPEIPLISAATDEPGMRLEIPDSAVFNERTILFSSELMQGVYGKEYLDEMKVAMKRQEFFMSRAPRAVMATAAPFFALAYEALDQGKNILVSQIKEEKYNPLEQRMISELLPEQTPTAVQIAANLGESLFDVALIGGAIDLAKKGTLTETIKLMATKMQKAGYGTGRGELKIDKKGIAMVAKDTSLEEAMKNYVKVAKTKLPVHPSRQIPSKAVGPVRGPLSGEDISVVRSSEVEKPINIRIEGPAQQGSALEVYQGRGRPIEEIYTGLAKPVMGDANYYAFTSAEAAQFGEVTKKSINLKNPLVINSDEQWRVLVNDAGWPYANLHGMPGPEASALIDTMKRTVLEKGYDSVIVKLAEDDSTKSLRRVFGISQIIDYTGKETEFNPAPELSEEQKQKQKILEREEQKKIELSRIDAAQKLLDEKKISLAQFERFTKDSRLTLKAIAETEAKERRAAKAKEAGAEEIPLSTKSTKPSTPTLEERALKAKSAEEFIKGEENALKMQGIRPSFSEDTKRQLTNFYTKAHGKKPPEGGKNRLPIQMPKYKKVTFAKMFTAQNRQAELLGLKPLVQDLEIGKIHYDLERRTLMEQMKKVINELKKRGTVSTEEMARLLDTNEEPPESLQGVDWNVFSYFRALTREILKRTNESRAVTGREPIVGIKAYFRRIAKTAAEDIYKGEANIPVGLQDWAAENIKTKVFNPMEIKRKLTTALAKQFSTDLEFVMGSMIRIALREIHMDAPLNFFHEKFAEVKEDIPENTRKWLVDYVNIVLGEQPTRFDQEVNALITGGPLAAPLAKFLERFGIHMSQQPVTDFLVTFSKLPLYGVLGGFRPKLLIRNKFQTLQNLALYGMDATWKGMLPTTDFPLLEELKSDSLFLKSYSGIEEMPADLKGKISKASMAAFQWSAVSNVDQAMNAAFHWTMDLIQDPANKKYGWADPARTYTEDRDFVYPSEREKLLREMEYGAQTTQYQYLGLAMPEWFRYKALAPITRLNSWWMNHFFVFHREAITRAVFGQTGTGESVPPIDRWNYLKYLIIGGVILNALNYERSYLLGTAPTSIPPSAQVISALYTIATNQGEDPYKTRNRNEAVSTLKKALPTFIPGYLTLKDANAFLNTLMGKGGSWSDYFFYTKMKKKEKAPF